MENNSPVVDKKMHVKIARELGSTFPGISVGPGHPMTVLAQLEKKTPTKAATIFMFCDIR